MILLVAFAVIFFVGQILNVGISIGVEHFSKEASLIVFFALFAAVVVFGWLLAVRITDRYLTSPEAGRGGAARRAV